jgi:lysophospholipase L1-like esterase
MLAAAGVLVALALAEIVLRLAHFEFQLMPIVQVGWPDPQTIESRYIVDPDLLWVTRDYQDKLRSARRARPAVVFMGDSCTEFGHYPALAIQDLASSHGIVVSGLHVAAGGWTSEQGVAQLGRDILPLHPRVVVVYYGWNDHWMALGPTDSELILAHRFIGISRHSRVAQLALKAWMGVAARHARNENRVPPARYRANLEQIGRTARRAGVVPIFVTAPSNHVPGREPAYLLLRHVRTLGDVIPLHTQYTQITREAATESHAILCDAAAHFAGLPPPRDRYFRTDGIHFTDAGDRELATFVSGCIASALSPRQ